MNPRNFREQIIRPTLKLYGTWSSGIEELLMLTAAVESSLGEFVRQSVHVIGDGLGVGLGPYSMEPPTFTWMQMTKRRNELAGRTAEDMVWDWRLATIAARLRYIFDPEPLPNDPEGLAKLWKRVYNGNSPQGRTWQDAELAYRRLVK